jgi:pSer/pThr/pTyr-binding forkhead associated (FHA) protein
MFRVVFHDQIESAFTLSKEQPQLEIGRLTNQNEIAPPGSVKLDSRVISRKHAVIMLKDDKMFIQDTKSSSGTFVNGERLSSPGQPSEWRLLSPNDTVIFGEDCEVDGVTFKAVPMICKQLKTNIGEPVKLTKLKTQQSNSSLQSEIESATEPSIMDERIRGDIKDEFDAVWESLQNGLEPHVKEYQKIALPYMKAMNQTGLYGDIGTKPEANRYSVSSHMGPKVLQVNVDKSNVQTSINALLT